ncbi:unnamed protein product [Effrenium voratum]|uniref:Pentatricopeptide repeat-containing protein, chloroplastic n=1 Tax=Effrenium voratum TaxID=2562239 RepID=A0AA36JB22_9DINO|nr:unnamed protein product [Effrenium voratum]
MSDEAELREQLGQEEDEVPEADSISLSIVIRACGQGRRWTEALRLFHFRPRREFASPLGAAAALLRNEPTETEAELMMRNATITACDKASAWVAALQLLPGDLCGSNSALSACAKRSRWQKALALLDQMPRKDIISYNTCITACRELWAKALALLQEAQNLQLRLTTISFNAAIASCDKGHRWQKAVEIFEAMRFARVQPSQVTYNSLISACEVGLPLQQLLRLTQHPAAFAASAAACAKQRAWAAAVWSLAQAPKIPLGAGQATLKACAEALQWRCVLDLLAIGVGRCEEAAGTALALAGKAKPGAALDESRRPVAREAVVSSSHLMPLADGS